MKRNFIFLFTALFVFGMLSACSSKDSSKTEVVPSSDSGAIEIVKGEYLEGKSGFHHFSYTVKNISSDTIYHVSLAINLLDKDNNIISTTYPLYSGRLQSGQSVDIPCLCSIEDGAVKVKADSCAFWKSEDGTSHENIFLDHVEEIILQ